MIVSLRSIALALAALVTLGTAAGPASAQFSPEELLVQLDGLETAYARKYISDDSLGFVTPVVADESTPSTLLVTVLEFGTEAEATDAFDTAMNGLVASMILGVDVEEIAIDDLGDRAVGYRGVEETSDEPEHKALLAVQDGNLGILIEASGADASMVEVVSDVAAFIVAAEPSADPVTVGEHGVTGGTFELMPTLANEDVLRGLIPMYEYDLLLNGGTEPLDHMYEKEATPAG